MQIDRPIAIALTLFIILLLIFFLVVPEYSTFKKLQTELGEKKAEFNAEYAYYDAITKVHSDLQGRKDDVKKIDDALPENPALGSIVYFLQQTAKGNGLIAKDLFLSKSAPAGSGGNSGIKDLVFSMDLLGSYPSLENFIISLEKSARIFEVTNISFGSASSQQAASSQSQEQTQLTYSFSVQIKTYSY